MTAILGVSAFYHDSAAALVVDGEIVAAAQEERFTRNKHDAAFPARAIEYCLEHAGIKVHQLDFVGYYEKPLVKFNRLLETYLSYAPAGFGSFLKALPIWLHKKLYLPRVMRRGLKDYRRRFIFAAHHESHAASAFFPSPFEEAAILTADGVGEWSTASIGVGRGNRIELTHELRFPHSLGLLYSAFTYYCGFKVNSGEYKLMGLAPYGEPRFAELIREKLIDLKPDGSFRMDMRFFTFAAGLTMTGREFARLFGQPARRSESQMSQHYMDVAASIQLVTEEIMLRMARHAYALTGMENLCLAGGVALNCVANGRIAREGPFKRLWIQPAAGDAGSALGTALLIWHQLLEKSRSPASGDLQHGTLLGPHFGDTAVAEFLSAAGAKAHRFDDDELFEAVAGHLSSEKVVGWFQGRMEFGPRALGGRSILGDARSPQMQTTMNLKIKFRESFRPFAPSVLAEQSGEYFDVGDGQDSPYMLLVGPVREDKRTGNGNGSFTGLDKLKQIRSQIPAVTHVDYSARVQTVDAGRNERYHRLISAFYRRTGCPVIINTSFNVRGEPIVCTPEDAYRCFMTTNMDVLVLGNHVLLKHEQENAKQFDAEAHLAKFQLD
ncbi:MAG: carbamoyltransferase [Planctomycetes bacterium]|nr:carbamoyltransferase [Planctomycetota bacterium]